MKVAGSGIAAAALLFASQASAEMPEFEVGGVVEVEASNSEDYDGNQSSDIVLATVELSVDAVVNDRVSAHIAFLYEEDATDFGLDEGTISLGLNDGVLLTAGKMYVPFGRYDSFMVSDPQTLVMGETVETVLMLSMEIGGLYGSAYVFNGDSDEASTVADGDDNGISSGLNVGYAMGERFEVGASYISNIGDSNTLQELESSGSSLGVVDSSVAGASVHFTANLDRVTILGEHVAALDSFRNGDLDGTVTNEEQPSASNLEIGFDVGNGINIAAAYQMTDEALFIGLPEKVTSAAVSYEVMQGANLAAEYATMEDYATSDGGSGETAHAVTVKLAVEF